YRWIAPVVVVAGMALLALVVLVLLQTDDASGPSESATLTEAATSPGRVLIPEAPQSGATPAPGDAPATGALARSEISHGKSKTVGDDRRGHVVLPDGSPATGCDVVICDCSRAHNDAIRALDADELEDAEPPGADVLSTDAAGTFALPETGEQYVI